MMKTIEINLKKWLFNFSGALFLVFASCTKDDIDSAEELDGIELQDVNYPYSQPEFSEYTP